MFAQVHCPLAVLGDEGEEVEGATDGGESGEPKGEGVSPDVPGGITSQDAEGRDGHSAVPEANLEGGTNATPQVPTNFWSGISDDVTRGIRRGRLTIGIKPNDNDRNGASLADQNQA